MKYIVLSCFVLLANLNLLFAQSPNIVLKEDNPRYRISVTHGGESIGEMIIELFPEVASKHVHNFDSLVSIGFYNGTAFHRVIPKFMIQGGDPNSRDKPEDTWGYGDPSQTTVPAEFSTLKHERGILSAARAVDINSATSQFFICVAKSSHLDGKYSIYGQVLEGMEIADIIVNVPRNLSTNRPIEKVEMTITKIDPSDVKESNNNLSDAIISPNPATDYININVGDRLACSEDLKIYNAMGECVMNLTPALSEGEGARIDVSQLAAGVYVINYGNVSQKIIIAR